MKPVGSEYLGSAVVHFYGNRFDGGSGHCVCQAPVGKTPEGLAIIGAQQLKIKLMDTYGIPQPRTRS